MAANWLKLNDCKSEFIIFWFKKEFAHDSITSSNHCRLTNQHVCLCQVHWSNIAQHTESGEADLSNMHVYHLHLISRIKKYLTHEQIISGIHACVTSHLDKK